MSKLMLATFFHAIQAPVENRQNTLEISYFLRAKFQSISDVQNIL